METNLPKIIGRTLILRNESPGDYLKEFAMYHVAALREAEFPITQEHLYFNNAGIAPLPQRSQQKMAWALQGLSHHPTHFWQQQGMPMAAAFQEELAAHIHAANPQEIVATSSTSAAINAVASIASLTTRGISAQLAATKVITESISKTAPRMPKICGRPKRLRRLARSARIAARPSPSIQPFSAHRATSPRAFST